LKKAYFDSSAIVKLGVPETESQALIDYLSEQQFWAVTSVVADVEVRRTLQKLKLLGADTQEHVKGFFLIELSKDVRDRAVTLGSRVRSLDAIHLATALALDDDVDFVTYDDRLAAAAQQHGLRVIQPGR
jgi:uncharacterized protein